MQTLPQLPASSGGHSNLSANTYWILKPGSELLREGGEQDGPRHGPSRCVSREAFQITTQIDHIYPTSTGLCCPITPQISNVPSTCSLQPYPLFHLSFNVFNLPSPLLTLHPHTCCWSCLEPLPFANSWGTAHSPQREYDVKGSGAEDRHGR